MQSKRDLAIVLRSLRYQDRHRIVTALTLHSGKITVLAKNSVHSRRFGGTLEPFVASEWEYQQKEGAEFGNLTQVRLRRAFEGIRDDLDRLAVASILSEVLIRITHNEEPAEELFKLHSNALSLIESSKGPQDYLPVLVSFFAKTLKWCGNNPQAKSCSVCGESALNQEQEVFFAHPQDAKIICQKCDHSTDLTPLSVTAICDLIILEDQKIQDATQNIHSTVQELEKLFSFLLEVLYHHVPGFDQTPIKSLQLLSSNPAIVAKSNPQLQSSNPPR